MILKHLLLYVCDKLHMKDVVNWKKKSVKKVWMSLDVGSQDKYQSLSGRSLHGAQRGQQQTHLEVCG